MDAETVSAEYRRLGYDQGWTFGMTPVANMRTARAIMVGLNPGGDGEGEVWEYGPGNAYFDDRWIPGSDALTPIQVQVAALHGLLSLGKDEVFAGQFIPFRTRSRRELVRTKETFAFGLRLWRWVIEQSPARLYLCLGADAAFNIASLIEASPDGPRLPTGWGSTTVGRYVSACGKVVVELPHLSRYLLFSMEPGPLATANASILEACRPVETSSPGKG